MMKKLLLFILFIVCIFQSYGQQSDTVALKTNKDYLQISRNHKTGAWILTGIGTAVLTGALGYDLAHLLDWEAANTTPYYVVGLASVGTGIFLFRSAAKNKRLAKANLTGNFKVNTILSPILPKGAPTNFPAVALQLHLK